MAQSLCIGLPKRGLMKNHFLKHLTGRDYKILELLGTHGCASAGSIQRSIWPSQTQTKNHFRRLRALQKRYLVEAIEIDFSKTKGFRLTKKGRALMQNRPEFKDSPPIRKSYPTQYRHDQMIFDVLMNFSDLNSVFNIKTDQRIQKEIRREFAKKRNWDDMPSIPDGTFQVKDQGVIKTVAIEVELTKKIWRRYEKIFLSHLLTNRWNYVIYFCKDEKLLGHLLGIYQNLLAHNLQVRLSSRINKMYFCSANTSLQSFKETPLFGAKNIFSLKNFETDFEDVTDKERKFYSSSSEVVSL